MNAAEQQAVEAAFDALVEVLITQDEIEQLEQYNSELDAIDSSLAQQYEQER